MGLFSSLFGGSKPKQNTYQQRPQNTPNVKVTMKAVAKVKLQVLMILERFMFLGKMAAI